MKNFLSCDDLRRGGGDEIHVPGCVFGLFGQGSHSVTRQRLCDRSGDCRL